MTTGNCFRQGILYLRGSFWWWNRSESSFRMVTGLFVLDCAREKSRILCSRLFAFV